MTKAIKAYQLPKSAHDMARKIYADIMAVSQERAIIVAEYVKAAAELEERFAAPAASIAARLSEIKLKGSEALCEAVGIQYRADCGYAIDTSYLEDLDVAFIQEVERDNGKRFDGMAEDMPPAGTKLN